MGVECDVKVLFSAYCKVNSEITSSGQALDKRLFGELLSSLQSLPSHIKSTLSDGADAKKTWPLAKKIKSALCSSRIDPLYIQNRAPTKGTHDNLDLRA